VGRWKTGLLQYSLLTILGALEKILLVAGNHDDDGRLLPLDAEELQARANDFKEEYTRFLQSVENRNGTADRILYMQFLPNLVH
jgi:hypothetical protein